MARNLPAGPWQRTVLDQQKVMQSVFRVALEAKIGKSPTPEKTTVYTRRSHKKSRHGCRTCKQRRIKCDENREGGCLKCQSHGIACDYNKGAQVQGKAYVILPKEQVNGPAPSCSSDTGSTESLSLIMNNSRGSSSRTLTPLSLLLNPASPFPFEVPDQITPVVQTFNHFGTVTYCSMGSDLGQEIIRATAFDLALEKPYLMHAANGIAAAHLCHLLPAARHPVQHNQNQLTNFYHFQKAFQLFRDELSAGVTKDNMNALISTVMLICVHQFMLTEPLPDPGKSFVYAPAEHRRERLRWLTIQHGFNALYAELGEVIWRSVWNPVFTDSDFKELAATVMTAEAGDETHVLFLELCEIVPGSSTDNNPYYEALEHLLFLRRLKPGMKTFNKLVTFVAVVEGDYLQLLLSREKRALLILAHWLALMIGVEQWWSSGRCKMECTAITAFLMHDQDERVRALLRFPAESAGFDPTTAVQSPTSSLDME
ncbi:uncharacterized protein Z519_04529 [Cladophialophora bantiana CBS 173.52]|uniref:Zn(2)-C6 fungal-type domain-containing protein n=1 Tax=Cladophialophora bantiana (strain ATCC 10958 / CBS 173.52 / CDC B-1940 / NIH 8579) TaxID=1442370 RepID=A0A0D2HMJ5_CLAB1|nr:uncharacterized protein Z519_04529 [Cladophialophora bantiana CBS 173.52]KIW94553.1 hypothetical protein Z519_04529 [Cladophialophora bantiana CBS 173.52]